MKDSQQNQNRYRNSTETMKPENEQLTCPLDDVILVDAKIDLHVAYKAVGAWAHLSSDARMPDYKPVWILAAVDAYSRAILAISVLSGPPTVNDSVELVDALSGHDAVAKGWPEWLPHGKLEKIHADESPAFCGDAFQDAVRKLTGKKPQSLRGRPVFAGRGERVIRSVFSAPRIVEAFADIAHAVDGEHLDDAKIVAAMAAIHNEAPQRGLGGLTPKAFVISACATMDDAA